MNNLLKEIATLFIWTDDAIKTSRYVCCTLIIGIKCTQKQNRHYEYN